MNTQQRIADRFGVARQTFDAERFLQQFDAMNVALEGAGFPVISPWWLGQIRRFVRALGTPGTSGARARQWVIRCGRRGGKSSTLCRLAVAWVLFGRWHVPPGDLGHVMFVSTSRDEASQRLRTIEAILKALGVQHRKTSDTLELVDRPACWKVFTATVAGVAGPTAIMVIGDEVALWSDRETGANPAREIFGQLRPTVATQPFAPVVLSSSAFGKEDFHYREFERGDTEFQVTSEATTWEANPTITEEETHGLEPDETIWRRQYANQPQDAVTAAWPAQVVDACFGRDVAKELEGMLLGAAWAVADPSSGKRDSWVSMICRWYQENPDDIEPEYMERKCSRDFGQGRVYWTEVLEGPDGQPIKNPMYGVRKPRDPILVVENIVAHDGSFWTVTSGDQVVKQHAEVMRQWGVLTCFADQREELMLRSMFAAQGINWHVLPWSNPTKAAGVERLRRWLRERSLILPSGDDRLRRELLAFRERLLPSGTLTWDGGQQGDDRVACLITAGIAETEGLLPHSPLGPRRLSQQEQHQNALRDYQLTSALGLDPGAIFTDEYGRSRRWAPPGR